MYHSQYKYTRCGAISPGDSSKVAHDSRRLFTFHAIYQLKNGINFQHLVYSLKGGQILNRRVGK